MLDVGDKLPDISVPDDVGAPRRLADFPADWLVVFFYPKDFTGG
mgnify:CR=1 FL=1